MVTSVPRRGQDACQGRFPGFSPSRTELPTKRPRASRKTLEQRAWHARCCSIVLGSSQEGEPMRMKNNYKALAAVVLVSAVACAINPATGKRQVSLIGEQQEIQLGRDEDQQI